MKPDKRDAQLYNFLIPEHLLVFVYSGELMAGCDACKLTVKSGEYIFLCKNTCLEVVKKPAPGYPFRSVSFRFNEAFLYEYYNKMNKKNFPLCTEGFNRKVVELTKTPYLESLYISMIPYVRENVKPIREITELKLMEAVIALLTADERFYTCFFNDFLLFSDPEYVFSKNFIRPK